MKLWLAVLLGVVAVWALLWLLSLVTGVLFWGGLALIVGAVLWMALRGTLSEPLARKGPGRVPSGRSARAVNRALRDLKRGEDLRRGSRK